MAEASGSRTGSNPATSETHSTPPLTSTTSEPVPGGVAVATGTALLAAVLAVVWGWLVLHVGPVPGSVVAALVGLVMFLAALHDGQASESGKRAFTRSLSSTRIRRMLGGALVIAVLLAGTVSSVQVTGGDSTVGTDIWIEGHGSLREGAPRERRRILVGGALRRIGVAFTRVPVIYSEEYILASAESLRPFLPRTYRYPDDFEPRLAITIVPDGALFVNVLQREYRLRVLDAVGRVVADTTLGGSGGTYSLSIDGRLPERSFEARVRAEQPERDPTELAQRLARWKQSLTIRSRRAVRANDRLRIDVLHSTSERLLSQSFVVSGPGQIIYLQ